MCSTSIIRSATLNDLICILVAVGVNLCNGESDLAVVCVFWSCKGHLEGRNSCMHLVDWCVKVSLEKDNEIRPESFQCYSEILVRIFLILFVDVV